MLACFGLAVLSVPVAGGRFALLAGLRFRAGALLAVAIGVQVVVISVVPGDLPGWAAAGLHLSTYGLAAGFLAANRRVAGLWVVAAGAAANAAAITANNGVMPASPGALATAGRALVTGEFENSAVLAHPRLAFLGDVFAVPGRVPLANVFSVGDVLIVVGAAAVLHCACGSRLAPRSRARLAAQASSETERSAERSTSISAPASMSSSAVRPLGSPAPRNSPAVGPCPPSAFAASTTAAEFQVGCSDV